MQSENFNLDDLFREKETEAKANLRLREQGKQRLFDRMHTAPMQQTGGRSFTVFYQAVAVLVLVMAALYFATDLSKEIKPVSRIQTRQERKNAVKEQPPLRENSSTEISTTLMAPASTKAKKQVAMHSESKQEDHPIVSTHDSREEKKQPLPVAVNNSLPNVTSPLAAKLVLNKFFTSLQKPAQVFTIDTGEDQTIRGDEGTKIFIPANTFVESGGRPVTGVVKFSLIECYQLDQITAHKLSTTSNGELLETGGMLYMHASANGREVFIADGATVDVSMPAKNFHPRMQLFYGSNAMYEEEAVDETSGKDFAFRPGPTNWIAAGQEQLEWTTKRKTVRVVNYIDNPVTVKDVKGKMVAHYIISPSCDLTIEQVKKELEKRYLSRYDEILVTRESKFKKQISTNPFQASVYVGDSVNMPMTMAMRMKLITRADSARLEREWLRELEVIEENKKAYAEIVKMREQYLFKVTKLGWINCDRFLNLPKNQLIEYTINPGMQFDNNVCYSTLLFHKTNSILEGSFVNGEIRFARLPAKAAVTILCIGVKDGVTYVATRDLKLDDHPPLLDFKVMAPDEFKALLARFVLN